MRERRYYTDNPTQFYVLTALVVVIGSVVALFLPDGPGWVRGFAIVNLAYWTWVFARGLRLGVCSSPGGLRINNLFRTYELDWEEIDGLTIESTAWAAIAATVNCSDGRRIHCSGVQHPWMSTVERAYEGSCGTIVRQLNRDLERYSTERSASGKSTEAPRSNAD